MRLEILKLLEDARSACSEGESFVNGKSLRDIHSDVLIQRGVERSLEIIGESLRRLRDLDPEVASTIPQLTRVIGLRNVLAHGYDGINYDTIWDIAVERVPVLRTVLEHLLNSA